MIDIDGLRMRFGRFTAVDGLTLHVERGESLALWGANGAGKSTVIRCVLGLHRYQGSVRIAGHDALRDGKRARRMIGHVPQEVGFHDDARAGEALRLFARLRATDLPDVEGALAQVGLRGQSRKRMRELSGGMKQRLALAIALLGDPPVLVLDEVTASMDACGREELVGLLARLSDAGRTLLFASHRQEEVRALATRVVVLEDGRAVRSGTVADVAGVIMPRVRERVAFAQGGNHG